MKKSITKRITKFLKYWNNNHLIDRKSNSAPINPYYFEALEVGYGFTLKWFVCQTDFDTLVKELRYPLEKSQTKILLSIAEYRIEIELDTYEILGQVESTMQPLKDLLDSLEKPTSKNK